MWSVSRSVTVPSQSRTSRISAIGHASVPIPSTSSCDAVRRRRRGRRPAARRSRHPAGASSGAPRARSPRTTRTAPARRLRAAPSPRTAGRRARPESISSGVTTAGPSTSPKSDCFTSGCSAGSLPLDHRRRAADLAAGADHGRDPRTAPRGRAPATGDARPDDCGRVGEPKRAVVVEDAHRRRVLHGHEQGDVGERVLGVLARAAAAEEERLQRLRGEVKHAVAVDPADPPALERVVVRVEHAEAHRAYSTWNAQDRLGSSGLGVHDHLGDARDDDPDPLLDPSRPSRAPSARLSAGSSASVRKTTSPSSVWRKRTARGGTPGRLADDALDLGRVVVGLAARGRLGERLEVALDVDDLRAPRRRSPARPAPRSPCASSSGSSPGSLRWSETWKPSGSSITDRLWISRTRETDIAASRTRSRSAASAPAGSTWTTTSLPGSACVDGRLDAVGDGMALADGGARARRRSRRR